jgi:hypothetical protein
MQEVRTNMAGKVCDSGWPPLCLQVIPVERDGVTFYRFSSWRAGLPLKGKDGYWSEHLEPPRDFDSLEMVAEFFDSNGWMVEWNGRADGS